MALCNRPRHDGYAQFWDWKRQLRFLVFPVIVLCLAAPSQIRAQEATQTGKLRIGLYVSPPFVTRDSGEFGGMSVELWERLASRLDLQYDYSGFDTLGDLVTATAAGQVDIAVTNLTITQNRAERIDFTQPWFDAGLRIMVEENRGSGFADIFRGLRQSGHLRAYAWLVLVVLVATVLLTILIGGLTRTSRSDGVTALPKASMR